MYIIWRIWIVFLPKVSRILQLNYANNKVNLECYKVDHTSTFHKNRPMCVILIMKANVVHNFSNLFDKVLYEGGPNYFWNLNLPHKRDRGCFTTLGHNCRR
jgi:hypothetical protein